MDISTNPCLRLTSPICPSVNHYLSYRAIVRNGRPMAMSYCTPEAKRYKAWFSDYIREEVAKQGWTLVPNKHQHFYVDAVFYFPRIDMDSSNYFKVMLDAVTDTQLIWLDDNVALERVQAVYYDVENPRIELCIHPVDYIGVFNSAPQLEKFVSKCADCTRGARSCSLLNKAKEGRIQNEIKNGVCLKFKPKKGEKGNNEQCSKC